MLTADQILPLFEKCGALIRDSHVVYTSGKHGKEYVNKDAVYPHTSIISSLCEQMAERSKTLEPEAVIGPALGGIVLSQWVASHLSRLLGREILSVYAEKGSEENFVVRRGYDGLIRNKRVLIVEDILTTGGSVRRVVESLKTVPCHVVGVAALCNRGNLTKEQLGPVPHFSALISLNLKTYEANECPLCKAGVPINSSVGKGTSPQIDKKATDELK